MHFLIKTYTLAIFSLTIFTISLSESPTPDVPPPSKEELLLEAVLLMMSNDTMTNLTSILKSFDSTSNFSHPYPHSLGIAPGNLKKAQKPLNSSEIYTVRDLVRAVLNSRAAPVVKGILYNLDRDLFKLFTPTDPPPSTDNYKVIVQHAYPNATTEGIPTSTGKNSNRHIDDGGTLAPVITKYRVNRNKITTEKTAEVEENEEDDSAESNNIGSDLFS